MERVDDRWEKKEGGGCDVPAGSRATNNLPLAAQFLWSCSSLYLLLRVLHRRFRILCGFLCACLCVYVCLSNREKA